MAEDNAPHGDMEEERRETRKPVPPSEETKNQRDQTDQKDPEAQRDDKPRQSWTGRLVSGAILLLAAVAIVIAIAETNRYPRTDDAEVLANFIGMAPLVNGPISQLDVRDNQLVHAGDVLFRVDDRPYKYALERAVSDQAALEGQIIDESRRIRSQESAAQAAQAGTRSAEANVDRAAAAVDEATADIGNAQAGLARAQAEYAYSLNNLHRVEPLLAKQFVTVDQVDQLRTGTAAKQLAVQQAEAQLRLTKARLQSSYAALSASRSDVSQSQAQRQQSQNAVTTLQPYTGQRGARESAIQDAEYNLNNCTVQAPFNARVTDLTISNGEYAHAGQQVFTLIDTRVWWVVANFRETQLHRILPGMHVDVYLLSDPNRLYRGVVDSTSFGVTPDASTVGMLTPGLPDVQRTLSWVHLASRYPVRIRVLDPEPDAFRISESAVVIVRGWNGW
jgi:multidrug efflux system membrane fusion protein